MGLTGDQFWRLTPRRYHYLARAVELRDRKHTLNSLQICAQLINIHRDHKKHPEPVTVGDLVPAHWKEGAPKAAEAVVPEWQKQLSIVEMLNVAFGGADKRPKNGPG